MNSYSYFTLDPKMFAACLEEPTTFDYNDRMVSVSFGIKFQKKMTVKEFDFMVNNSKTFAVEIINNILKFQEDIINNSSSFPGEGKLIDYIQYQTSKVSDTKILVKCDIYGQILSAEHLFVALYYLLVGQTIG